MENNTKLTLKIYWRHLQPYRRSFFAALFCIIAANVANLIEPILLKRLLDAVAGGGGSALVYETLLNILVAMLFLKLLGWVFWRLSTFLHAHATAHTINSLYNFCFRYLHKHSYTFFNNNFVGSLVKKANWFARAFEDINDRVSWHLLPLLVALIFVLSVLFQKNVWLGLSLVAWLVVFLAINYVLGRWKFKYDLEHTKADTEASKVLADTVTNQVNVKLFNGYQKEVSAYARVQEKARRLLLLVWNIDNTFEALQALLSVILEVGTLYISIWLWRRGMFTVGDFALLQTYVWMIIMRIWDFGRIIRHVFQRLADAEEMTEILQTPHEIVDKPQAKNLLVTEGEIMFKDLSFSYLETRSVLNDFNLLIRSHEKIALVGPSGAGKSTITRLLLRLHEVTAGKILIDGQNIADVTQESLWANLSLVPQDPILFHRTLMENIRYGRFGATDAEVIEAAKLAHCHEFISEFPEGYNTYVGERGVKLSGGERQRVAIARAILRAAPILILDEATSSLDSQSEHLIQDALSNLMKNKTVITVAHRLSTIMKMDRILVIDNGGIVEEGTHAELLKKDSGIYKKLWSIQAGGFIQ